MCRQSSKDLGTHFDFASGHDLITLRHMTRYSQSLKATRWPDHVEISGGQEGHIGIICEHPCWATWSCLSQINGLTVGPVAGCVVIFGRGNGLSLDIYLTTFDILWPCFSLSYPFMVIQMLFWWCLRWDFAANHLMQMTNDRLVRIVVYFTPHGHQIFWSFWFLPCCLGRKSTHMCCCHACSLALSMLTKPWNTLVQQQLQVPLPATWSTTAAFHQSKVLETEKPCCMHRI